jgi:hypothetical protein
MITTYATTLTAVDFTESERIALIDVLTDWQMAHYPIDDNAPGTTIRVREGSDDPVFRIIVTQSSHGRPYAQTISASVIALENILVFDVRIVATPTTTRVAPIKLQPLPPHIVRLVHDVLATVHMEDANEYLSSHTQIVSHEEDGARVGALVHAPRRTLPVVVEIDNFDSKSSPIFPNVLGPLTGLVHHFRITTREAMNGYLSLAGDALVGPGHIIVHWAGATEPLIERRIDIRAGQEFATVQRIATLITEVAARTVSAPRLPPPPRYDDEAIVETQRTTSDEDERDEQDLHIEQLEAAMEDMQAALADADRIIAEQRQQIEQKGGQLDELILRNVSLEIQAGSTPTVRAVSSMKEALRLAQQHCPHLIFHERALESGEHLEGPEPVSVLQDLIRLNEVARAWRAGEISGTSIVLACRQMGLDFAPRISDNARQKFEEDYLITWRGGTVRAEAHLRRGRKAHLVRIHVYFDQDTQEVVVAYIGRHLRDKHSQS